MKNASAEAPWPSPSPSNERSTGTSLTDHGFNAVVQVGAEETHYYRRGCGFPVLVIAEREMVLGRVDSLIDTLARHFRVVAPSLPADLARDLQNRASATLSCWLDGVLEGLGIEHAALVIAARRDSELFGLLEGSLAGIDRIAVVHLDAADGASPGLTTGSNRRVLAIPSVPQVGLDQDLDLLLRFLGDETSSCRFDARGLASSG